MSRLSKDRETLVDTARGLLLAGFDNGVGDPASLTSSDITLTYTTDDPSYTPDADITVADGDNITAAEEHILIEEMVDQTNKLRADVSAARTALVNLIGDNVFDVSAPAALTSASPSGDGLVAIAYTTDDPAVSTNGTVVIADGDLTTAVELNQYFAEWNAMAKLVRDDIGAVHERLTKIIGQRNFNGVSALPSLTSSSGFLTVTYTTDDPSVSPSGTLTIADGDSSTVADRNEAIAEIEAAAAAVVADLIEVRAHFTNYLAAADIA